MHRPNQRCVIPILQKALHPVTRLISPPYPIPGVKLYVNLTGSDSNPGTEEKPFQSLDRALDEARRIKKEGVPQGGIGILLAGGTYSVKTGMKMGPEFAGTKEAPLSIVAASGEVIFNAGVKVDGFAPVTDAGILERLPEEARGKVLQVNLKEHGITQYGDLISRGYKHF